MECVRGRVPPDSLLGIEAFSLTRALEVDSHFAHGSVGGGNGHSHHGEAANHGHDGGGGGAGKGGGGGGHEHKHAALGLVSVGVEIEDGPLNLEAFMAWLGRLIKDSQGAVVRLKGEGMVWGRAVRKLAAGGRTSHLRI
jgi:G3E family GTPase